MSYALTIFLSAFLLFQIQLIIGKFLLPWFGGTPAVWATCMMFFQVALLTGYAYAHRLVSLRSHTTQRRLHVVLLLASLAVPIVSICLAGRPFLAGCILERGNTAAHPVMTILVFLALVLAVPFVLLSATSPLLQHWYADAGRQNPYRLYAVSNAGSVLGLVTYPFLVEPLLDITLQIWLWTGAYVVFIVVSAACARLKPAQGHAPQTAADRDTAPPSVSQRLVWLLLPTATCALLLAVTNELCQEIAVVPFLWVVPLVLYLLSFIICFDGSRWYSRRIFTLLAVTITFAALIINHRGPGLPIAFHLVSLNLLLFVLCMLGHGELARLKPLPRHLTAFYLMVAAGGAIGGISVALIAPLVLPDFWELHIVLLSLWVLMTVVFVRDTHSFVFRGDPWHTCAACFIVLTLLTHFVLPRPPVHAWLIQLTLAAVLTIATAVATRKTRSFHSRQWSRLLLALVLLATEAWMLHRIRNGNPHTVTTARNFFGVVKVWERNPEDPGQHMRVLTHGRITHGIQFLSPETRQRPVAYYAEGSGIWCAMEYHPRLLAHGAALPLRIGVTGLGTGGLAPYAQKGDLIRFYEINPAVLDIARRDFTYISDCKGVVELVCGDARRSLEAELACDGSQQFDILVLDAFTSDAVPVHLLTCEAFEMYIRHLRDARAIIAVNISNRFVNFLPLMEGIAAHVGMRGAWIRVSADPPYRVPSSWYLMSRDASVFDHPDVARHIQPVPGATPVLWTDAFSNLMRLLTRRE